MKEIKKLKVKAFTLSFKTSSVKEKIYGTPCRRNSRTPYPGTGKTGSVDYLLVEKTFSHSEGLYKKTHEMPGAGGGKFLVLKLRGDV